MSEKAVWPGLAWVFSTQCTVTRASLPLQDTLPDRQLCTCVVTELQCTVMPRMYCNARYPLPIQFLQCAWNSVQRLLKVFNGCRCGRFSFPTLYWKDWIGLEFLVCGSYVIVHTLCNIRFDSMYSRTWIKTVHLHILHSVCHGQLLYGTSICIFQN